MPVIPFKPFLHLPTSQVRFEYTNSPGTDLSLELLPVGRGTRPLMTSSDHVVVWHTNGTVTRGGRQRVVQGLSDALVKGR